MPKEKYSFAPEIFEHSRAHRRALRPLRRRLLPDRGHRAALGRGRRSAGSSRTNRGDAMQGPLRGHGQRAAATGRSCPASRASTSFKGHTFHTSRWDYDYTGGDIDGGLTKLADKRVGDHRHRRHGDPVRAAPRRSAPSSSTSSSARRRRSTCAATSRPIRSGRRRCSPAGSSARMENFNILVTGGHAGRGPGRRRLDRHLPQPAAGAAQARRRAELTPEDVGRHDASSPTSRR